MSLFQELPRCSPETPHSRRNIFLHAQKQGATSFLPLHHYALLSILELVQIGKEGRDMAIAAKAAGFALLIITVQKSGSWPSSPPPPSNHLFLFTACTRRRFRQGVEYDRHSPALARDIESRFNQNAHTKSRPIQTCRLRRLQCITRTRTLSLTTSRYAIPNEPVARGGACRFCL